MSKEPKKNRKSQQRQSPEPIARTRIAEARRAGSQKLDLSGLQLPELPKFVRERTQLQELDVSRNRLTALPETLGQLTQLQWLNVSDNQLTALPEALGRLTQLQELDVSHNQLTALPETLSPDRFPSLRALYLHGNDVLGLPSSVLGPDRWETLIHRAEPAEPAEILKYYFRTRGGSRPLNEAKLILIGRGSVGKTSLVNRLVRDQFDKDEGKTPGIQITQWQVPVEPDTVRINIWDFGGQEIMHATHQFFLTERSFYILVLNGREGGEDLDAEYWLKLIESFGGESPVVVVLNKQRQQPFDLNYRALRAKYPQVRGFVKTDCEPAMGIEDLREEIRKGLREMRELRASFPASWFAIKDRLAAMRENYLSLDRYRELCRQLGEPDVQAQDDLAGYLHCLGIALHYRDDPRLRASVPS